MKIDIIITVYGGTIVSIEAFKEPLKAREYFVEQAKEEGVKFIDLKKNSTDAGELYDFVTKELENTKREIQWFETDLI